MLNFMDGLALTTPRLEKKKRKDTHQIWEAKFANPWGPMFYHLLLLVT